MDFRNAMYTDVLFLWEIWNGNNGVEMYKLYSVNSHRLLRIYVFTAWLKWDLQVVMWDVCVWYLFYFSELDTGLSRDWDLSNKHS